MPAQAHTNTHTDTRLDTSVHMQLLYPILAMQYTSKLFKKAN